MKKQKQKKPDGRCATCPRWDRWHIRIPNSEEGHPYDRRERPAACHCLIQYIGCR